MFVRGGFPLNLTIASLGRIFVTHFAILLKFRFRMPEQGTRSGYFFKLGDLSE